MKLEVGMYVKFKDKNGCTYIRKVIDGYKEHWYGCKVDKNANNVPYVSSKNIINASYNIIDLIEVGDYVNGYKVYEVDRECCRITLNGGDYDNAFRLTYQRPALGENMGIKSIVTKEQFESMEYRIGE